METEDIKKFKEELQKATFLDLKNKEFMNALTDLFVLIGDIFSLMKVPKTDYFTYTKLRQTKDQANQLRYKRKNVQEE